MNPLDPTLLTYVIIGLGVVFAIIAFFTRASVRRAGGALLSAISIVFLVMFYDRIASQMGWWLYPAVPSGEAPLAWYVASALFYGAGLGLIGWRVIRRWGRRGLLIFILAFTAFGVARDYTYNLATSGLIRFGPGIVPLLADCFAYASSALLVQGLMVWIAGRPGSDRLARAK